MTQAPSGKGDEQFTEPKSKAGKRSVPIAAVLRDYLIEHKATDRAKRGAVLRALKSRRHSMIPPLLLALQPHGARQSLTLLKGSRCTTRDTPMPL